MATAIRKGRADDRAGEGEDQADEREHDDVSRGHVGEETNRQRERLGQLADHFDRRHDQEHRDPHVDAAAPCSSRRSCER